jgi:hypothetical protein
MVSRSGTGSFAPWPPARTWTLLKALGCSRWRTWLRLTRLIGCWNDKYYWQFWRPITAIREADTDGNPATEADPTWLPLFDPSTAVCNPPLLFTPPFPDHPSGHCSATSAFVNTLQNFFGTDKISFSAFSNKILYDTEL